MLVKKKKVFILERKKSRTKEGSKNAYAFLTDKEKADLYTEI